jgi:hypothetical protein
VKISESSQGQVELFQILGVILLFVGLTVYLFFRSVILNVLLYNETFLLSAWVGAFVSSIVIGYLRAATRPIYLLYLSIFGVAYFIAVELVFAPVYAPQNL